MYFPKVKLAGGGSTVNRAPIAILKLRPPGHWKNELHNGPFSMEEAGRMAQLPRWIHLEIPFHNQPTKTFDAEYFVFDRQSNPPCDLQKCVP